MATKSFPYVLSCDWFAYSCLSNWCESKIMPEVFLKRKLCEGKTFPTLSEEIMEWLFREDIVDGSKVKVERRVGDVVTYKHYEFKLCESSERHPSYFCSVRVVGNGRDICHLFYGLKRDLTSASCLAKVANSLLYSRDWAGVFTDCLRALGWRWVGVNRVDLCCDFNYFANGRLPSLFVQDYLHQPTKNRPSFLRRGSNKWRANGERTISSNMIDTLSWGTRDSPVQVNLYNKTKELQQVHNKPWIMAKWNENGLRSGLDDAGVNHFVWRVEFSINPSSLAFRAKDHSRVFDVSLGSVADQGGLSDLFSTLLPRYFQFYYLPASNCPKRVRDLSPVVLFDNVDESAKVPMTLNRCIDSGRTERLLSKRLRVLMDTQQLDETQYEHVREAKRVFDDIAALKATKDWAPTEDVLYHMLVGLRTWHLKQKPYKLTASGVQRQASRLARLIMRGDITGFEKFDELNPALQDVIEQMRRGFRFVYDQLPDEYYNESLENFSSPYDMHIPASA